MIDNLKKLPNVTIASIVVGSIALIALILNLILGLTGVYSLAHALVVCIGCLFVISVSFLINFNPKKELKMFIYNSVIVLLILGIWIATAIMVFVKLK